MKKVFYYGIFIVLFFILSACDSNSPNVDDPEVPEQWSVGFLSRPVSEPIHIYMESNVKISNKSFKDMEVVAVIIESCDNVEITECDFSNVVGGIFILNCTNVTITWNRFSNIGDGTIGSGHSNYIQLNKSFGGYIAFNKGKDGDTEDMISIYMSGGNSEKDPLIIEYNHFESGNWKSDSGSGIMLGDAGGQYIVARYNKLLSPGQVGIGIASGVGISLIGNTVYGEKRSNSNVGMYMWNQYDTPIGDIEISGNEVRWYSEDGSENPYWNGEDFTPKEKNNNWHARLDPKKLRVNL